VKKFKFRLEPLKKIKEHVEKQRQKEHAVALQRVHTQQIRLEELEQSRLGVMTLQRDKQGQAGTVSPLELLTYSRYYLKLKRERIAGLEILRGLEIESESRRQKLVEASRQRKIYEKLKERQVEKFNKSTELILGKENDEISANTVRRRPVSS
jgi:flagellar FliJ protein